MPVASRDHDPVTGYFVKGNQASNGRARKLALERELKDAIQAKMPPEWIAAKLVEAVELAQKQGSPRGMVAALEVVLGYMYGRPRQQIAVSDEGSSELLAVLLANRTPLLPPRAIEILPPERPALPAHAGADEDE